MSKSTFKIGAPVMVSSDRSVHYGRVGKVESVSKTLDGHGKMANYANVRFSDGSHTRVKATSLENLNGGTPINITGKDANAIIPRLIAESGKLGVNTLSLSVTIK